MSLQHRIAIVGPSGAGKSTLARRIARRVGIKHIELDALHWGPSWKPRPTDVFKSDVSAQIADSDWIVDGNYRRVRDNVLRRANLLLWLNYPIHTVLMQAIQRTLVRALTRQVIHNGNRESFLTSFFRKESMILWAMRTYYPRMYEYRSLISEGRYPNLQVYELRNHRQADALLKRLWPT
jgi:adenylate kinase family enzyme